MTSTYGLTAYFYPPFRVSRSSPCLRDPTRLVALPLPNKACPPQSMVVDVLAQGESGAMIRRTEADEVGPESTDESTRGSGSTTSDTEELEDDDVGGMDEDEGYKTR